MVQRVALDIAGRAVAAAAYIAAVSIGHIFARLLYGALYAALLHVAIGRYFGIDIVTFEYKSQRHTEDEHPYGKYGKEYDGENRRHRYCKLFGKTFALSGANI